MEMIIQSQITILTAAMVGLVSCYVAKEQHAEAKRLKESLKYEKYYTATISTPSDGRGTKADKTVIMLTEVALNYNNHSVEIKVRTIDENGSVSDACTQLNVYGEKDREGDYNGKIDNSSGSFGHSSERRVTGVEYHKYEYNGDIVINVQRYTSKTGRRLSYVLAYDILNWDAKEGFYAPQSTKYVEPRSNHNKNGNSYYDTFEHALTTEAGAMEIVDLDYHKDHWGDKPPGRKAYTTGLMSESNIREFTVAGQKFNLRHWQNIFGDSSPCGSGSPSKDDYRQHN